MGKTSPQPSVPGRHVSSACSPTSVTRLAECVREPSDDASRVKAKIMLAMQRVQEQDQSIKELHESFKALSAENDVLRRRCKQLTELAVAGTRLSAATAARIARGTTK